MAEAQTDEFSLSDFAPSKDDEFSIADFSPKDFEPVRPEQVNFQDPRTAYARYKVENPFQERMGVFGPENPQEVLNLPDVAKVPGALFEKSGIPQSAREIYNEFAMKNGLAPLQEGEGIVPPEALRGALSTRMFGALGGPDLAQMVSIPAPVRRFMSGVGEQGAQQLSGLTTPENLALLPFAAAKPVQAGFMALTAGDIPEAAKATVESKTPEELGKNLVRLGANAAITAGIGRHLAGGEVPAEAVTPSEKVGEPTPSGGQSLREAPVTPEPAPAPKLDYTDIEVAAKMTPDQLVAATRRGEKGGGITEGGYEAGAKMTPDTRARANELSKQTEKEIQTAFEESRKLRESDPKKSQELLGQAMVTQQKKQFFDEGGRFYDAIESVKGGKSVAEAAEEHGVDSEALQKSVAEAEKPATKAPEAATKPAEAATQLPLTPETPTLSDTKVETSAEPTAEQTHEAIATAFSKTMESLAKEGWKFDPEWGPLEVVLKPEEYGQWMFMGKHPHPTMPGRSLYEYKNGITRRYLRLDDEGQSYGYQYDSKTDKSTYPPIPLEDAIARAYEGIEQMGEKRTTPYNEAFIQRRNAALLKAGIGVSRATPEGTLTSLPKESPKPKGIAASVRNKWTSATDEAAPLGSEAGFINLDVIRDFVDSVTPRVKNTFLAVKEIGREATRLSRMTDYRRSVLNWSAKLQRSFGEAAEAQSEIQSKVPSPERRGGITNWIQADGDLLTLTQRRKATEDWRDPVTGKPHPQQKQLLAGYDAAISLTPEEIAVAKDAQAAYAALGTRGQRYGVLNSFKDNYVTQIWNLARGPQGTGASRTLKDRFKFSRASTFPTFFDGEQAGYVPKTKDISKLLPVYLHEMNSVIAARQLVEQLSKGVASDGRPLVAPRGVGVPIAAGEGSPGATLVMPKAVKGGTADYRTLPNQPALSDWRWASNDTVGNPVFLKADLALHPEAYDRIKAVLGRSAIREWYSTRTSAIAQIPKVLAKGLDMANSETKRSMLGLLAPFHQVQEATHAVGHRVNPTFSIPKIDLVRDPGQMDAAKHGLMLLPDRASESQFMEGFRTSGLVSKIPIVGPLADWYSNYLFHEYIPGLKYKTYESILARNRSVYSKDLASGKVGLEDVKTLSAEQANAAYGHLNYADLGRNPTIQHLSQLFLLAPDFLESRARFAGQAARGAAGAKVGREQLIALATLAIAQAAFAYTAAKLTDGKWDASRPFEFVQGKRRYTMRSVPEDISSLIHNTRLYVHSRLSPVIGKGTLQYLSGVNALSKKVSAGETTKELAEQPIPISIRGFAGIGNSTLTGMEQLAGAVGLKISRYNPDQAKIDAALKIQDFADSVRGEAKKLPISQRYKFVKAEMAKQKLSVQDQTRVLRKLQQAGTFVYQ